MRRSRGIVLLWSLAAGLTAALGVQARRELVDYYDRRFDMRLSSQEKQDLINFLGVL